MKELRLMGGGMLLSLTAGGQMLSGLNKESKRC